MRAEIQKHVETIFPGGIPPPGYVEQIEEMARNAKAWRQLHRDEEVLIRWPEFPLVGAISDAVKAKMIGLNPAGLELLKALWPWDVDTEPTVFMCTWALELSQ